MSQGSVTSSTSFTGNTGLFRVGELYDGTHYYFPGYLSNVRVVKGTAVYTSNFTPSTAPLTAITNYCNGMLSRVNADAMSKDDLVAALSKTARQAERAGQIIHRIRAFVKKSEPQRQPAQAKAIVDDAVDLAGIELRRRNVAIRTYVAQRLPTLMVDPILIEQVVLNLLKNASFTFKLS